MSAFTLPSPKTFNTDLNRCWQVLQGGRTIAVYRCLIDLAGSLKAAAMLSQLIYWTRVSKEVAEREGWIYKTIAQMEEETGLTKREQGVCRDKLESLNLIVVSRKNQGGKLAFKVNLDELACAVARLHGYDTEQGLSIQELQSKSSLFFRRYFSQRIAYHRDLVTLTGCIHSAVVLSYVLQDAVKICHAHPDDMHAFSTLTITDWQEKTSLTYKSQLTARNRLKNLQFIFEKHFIASRRIFTLVNAKKILQGITNMMKSAEVDKKAAKQQKNDGFRSLAERAKKDWRKGRNGENQLLIREFDDKNAVNPPASFMTFRSDKRENSEVTKGEIQKLQNGKFRSDKRENSFFKYNNYNWIYKYNYYQSATAVPAVPEVSVTAKTDVDVVVVVKDDLVFPRQIQKHQRIQALNILRKQLPKADTAAIQEILDEIQGMKTEIRNPLGLLHKLALAAAAGNFIAVNAPTVRYDREQRAKHEQAEAMRREAEKLAFQEQQKQRQAEAAKPEIEEAASVETAAIPNRKLSAQEILAKRLKALGGCL